MPITYVIEGETDDLYFNIGESVNLHFYSKNSLIAITFNVRNENGNPIITIDDPETLQIVTETFLEGGETED